MLLNGLGGEGLGHETHGLGFLLIHALNHLGVTHTEEGVTVDPVGGLDGLVQPLDLVLLGLLLLVLTTLEEGLGLDGLLEVLLLLALAETVGLLGVQEPRDGLELLILVGDA